VIERAAIISSSKVLEISAALGSPGTRSISRPPPAPAQSEPITTLNEAMRHHITRALEACQGRIEGPQGAAKLLGINPHTLRARMRKLGVEWAQFRSQ